MGPLDESALRKIAGDAFRATGMRPDMADDAAEMLVLAEMMGIRTHGLNRIENYVERLRNGGVNPDADPVISAPAPALRHVDGQNGLGAAVAIRATRAAMEAAREAGLGAAFCRASSHLGALTPQLLHAAEAGFAAIFTTNTSPMIAPQGGRSAVIGNTPVGIALPDTTGQPVILDMALSVAARSKVRRSADKGEPIPANWATDEHGVPTTDAAAALKGMMQAIGGHKGANLALCLDLLAGGLSGAAILSEIPNANINPGAVANVGHLFVIIDVTKLISPDELSNRLDVARHLIRDSAPPDSKPQPRLPGARALEALAKARAEGLSVEPKLLSRLQTLAAA